MPVVEGGEAERDRILEVARAMCVSARTAPKAKGVDRVVTSIVYGEDLERLATEMERLGKDQKFFLRDAENVRRSVAVVLVGLGETSAYGLNCGGCGHGSCDGFRSASRRKGRAYTGPNCTFDLVNLGIALGSAVRIAADNCVDNRIMYSVGVAAKKLRMINANVVFGIPLSSSGKSIYFDRAWPVKAVSER